MGRLIICNGHQRLTVDDDRRQKTRTTNDVGATYETPSSRQLNDRSWDLPNKLFPAESGVPHNHEDSLWLNNKDEGNLPGNSDIVASSTRHCRHPPRHKSFETLPSSSSLLESSSSSSSVLNDRRDTTGKDVVMKYRRKLHRLVFSTILSTPLISFLLVNSLFVGASVIPPSNHGQTLQFNSIVNSHQLEDPLNVNHDPVDVGQTVGGSDLFGFLDELTIPLWVKVIFILALLTLSGLFSGLNLGLMALDQNDLKVIASCGTKKEKKFAATIAPVRARGNFLLCTLLLGNVLVNTTLTTLLDDVTGSGAIAVLAATLSIVIFGEILPQAICSRHGLAVGASTIGITYVFMALTAPLAYPISVALDKLLGEEIGQVYNREQLMEYIRITRDYNRLEDNEFGIITGALALRSKVAGDVMTTLDQVYMLPLESKLTYEVVGQINARGFSRIPVFAEGDKENMVGVLHTRDLALIDPADGVDLKDVLDYHKHPLIYVYTDTRLDYILQEFKAGRSHMALVRSIQTKPTKKTQKWMRVLGADDDEANHEDDVTVMDGSDEEEGDPFYKLEGIITLEDIIEEILGSEIVDESDVLAMKLRDRIRESSAMYGKKASTATVPYPAFIGDGNDGHCDACCRCICGRNIQRNFKNRIASESNLTDSNSPSRQSPIGDHAVTVNERTSRSGRKLGQIQRMMSTQSSIIPNYNRQDSRTTANSGNHQAGTNRASSVSSYQQDPSPTRTVVPSQADGDAMPLLDLVTNASSSCPTGLPPLPFRKSPSSSVKDPESLNNHRLSTIKAKESS